MNCNILRRIINVNIDVYISVCIILYSTWNLLWNRSHIETDMNPQKTQTYTHKHTPIQTYTHKLYCTMHMHKNYTNQDTRKNTLTHKTHTYIKTQKHTLKTQPDTH